MFQDGRKITMDGWIHGNCTANGIKIHYLRTGGHKPPIILLHGLMLSGACWTPLARALEHGYDVIMPDARGHGLSVAPDHGYCYENLAADVAGLIEALKLDTPLLLGHSMGGMTAAMVASQYPRLLSGLILADPTFLTREQQCELEKSDVAVQHKRILAQSKDEYLAEAKLRHSRRSPDIIELFAEARFQTSLHAFQVLKPPHPDYMQVIETFTVPCLLVIGDKGAVVSLNAAKELARRNPNVDFIQIAKAGHAVPFDQPERFAEVVLDFLNQLENVRCFKLQA